jgi:hypothetical protein
MKTIGIASAMLAAACASVQPAGAQEHAPAPNPSADEAVQTVVLRGVRNPDIAPYKDFYDVMAKVRKAGGGKVDLLPRVVSKQSGQPVPDLEVTLRGDTTSEKVALAPDGFVTISFDERYLADHAEFLTNKRQGTLNAEIHLVPALPKTNLTYGDIAASIAAVRQTLATMIPWYLRLFSGRVNEVKLCYPDNGRVIAIADGSSSSNTRPAAKEQQSPLTKETVYCAAFTDKETQAARDTPVAPPPGWVALFD